MKQKKSARRSTDTAAANLSPRSRRRRLVTRGAAGYLHRSVVALSPVEVDRGGSGGGAAGRRRRRRLELSVGCVVTLSRPSKRSASGRRLFVYGRRDA